MSRLKHIDKQENNIHCSVCFIKNCSLLKNCSADCLNFISASKHFLHVRKEEHIITEGGNAFNIYFVKSGRIKIYKSDLHGNELILRFAKPGELIGFYNSKKTFVYLESASALEDSFLCTLDQNDFQRIVRLYPELMNELLKYYQDELNQSEVQRIKLARLNVPGKIADALLTMYNSYGVSETNQTINLILSRKEIAALAGTTKEQVSKTLSEFKQQQIINTIGKRIKILNIELLKKLSKV